MAETENKPLSANSFFSGTYDLTQGNAFRNGNVISNLIDDNTGEYVTYTKVTRFENKSAMDDSKVDGYIYRKLGTEYFKRTYSTPLNVKIFGAKGDFNVNANRGTDDTQAFQRAIDFLILAGGGSLYVPPGVYLIAGTLYINASNSSPITIRGDVITARFDLWASSPTLAKNTSGDMFKVNLQSDGRGFLGSETQYGSFGAEGIIFRGMGQDGIVIFQMFRTRCVLQNISASSVDWLVEQKNTDSLNNANYCDQSIYSNIRISYPRIGCLKLVKNDAGEIRGLYLEGINNASTKMVSLYMCRSMICNGIVFWNMTELPSIEESNLFDLSSCRGVHFSNLHIERCSAKNIFGFNYCVDISIELLTTQFSFNNVFNFIQGNKNFELNGWTSRANHNVDTFDVIIGSSASNETKSFVFNQYFLETYSSDNTASTLDLTVKDLGNQNRNVYKYLTADLSSTYDLLVKDLNMTDLDKIDGYKFFSSVENPNNAPANVANTRAQGFQVLVNNNQKYKRQFIEFAGKWYSGIIQNGVRSPWVKIIDSRDILSFSVTHEFGELAPNSVISTNIITPGVVSGDAVVVGSTNKVPSNIIVSARAGQTGVISLTVFNTSFESVWVPSTLYKIRVIK